MVIDFGIIGALLCSWVEEVWDHRTLIWSEDPNLELFKTITPDGIAVVKFNPTAENMAEYLLRVVGPQKLMRTGVKLVKVKIEETAKCSAEVSV